MQHNSTSERQKQNTIKEINLYTSPGTSGTDGLQAKSGICRQAIQRTEC